MTSPYSKSPNIPGVDTILKNFHKMICEIISPKLCLEFSWFLFVLRFVHNFIMTKDLARKTFIIKNNFKELGVFFMGGNLLIWASLLQNNFILFFQVNSNRILKAYFINLSTETDKERWFYSSK